MVNSPKYAFLALRIGLAIVFVWLGMDKFFHPAYWINAWTPEWLVGFLSAIGMAARQFIYVLGIFEVLVALSLITAVFMRIFSFVAVLLLLSVFFAFPFSEVLVRDIGLMGGLAAVILWPERGSNAL